MRYVFYILFIINGSIYHSFAQSVKLKADSLHDILVNTTDLQKRNDIYLKLSGLYMKNKPDSALKYSKLALENAYQINNKTEIAKSFASIAVVYKFISEFDSSLTYQTKALAIYKSLNDSTNISRTLSSIGLLNNSQGNFVDAYKNYLLALKIAEIKRDSVAIGKIKINIGLNFYHEKEYDKALKYYTEALFIQQRLKEINSIGNINLNLGLIHQRRNELKKAQQSFNIALGIYKQTENKSGTALCYTNLGNSYTELKNYLMALDCHNKSLTLYHEINDKGGLARVYGNLAETYIYMVKTKDKKNFPDSLKKDDELLDKATSLLEKSIEIRLATGEKNSLHVAYASLAQAEELRGDYKSAFENLEKRTQLKDSLFNLQNKEMIANLEANDVIEDKEEIIKIQEVNIAEKERKFYYVLISLLLVVLTGIIIFYRNRIKQANKIEIMRNRIASDLHDEIGSTLSSISLSSTIIQNKIENNGSDVTNLLTQISENTYNMMEAMSDIVWSINTKHDRFENVVNRMNAFAITIFEPFNCSVIFNSDEYLNELRLDAAQRKNIYLIFKEAMNNAAKYAGCKHIWIDIYKKNNYLTFKIKDDGNGFEFAQNKLYNHEYNFGGNGLNNMFKRAEELSAALTLNSAIGKGTEIILEVKL